MENKPFWEQTYGDKSVSTFSKGPTVDVKEFYGIFPPHSLVLDVGCGEGRNSIFLAGEGHKVEAFDLSENGVAKAREIAREQGVEAAFFQQDLGEFAFQKDYDVILSHGVLHLPRKAVRDAFIQKMQRHTKPGGY